MTLKEIVDHIYGKINIIRRKDRPHVFIKELTIYIDYLKNKMGETSLPYTEKQLDYFNTFRENLEKGIQYYRELFSNISVNLKMKKARLLAELEKSEFQLKNLPG